MAHITLSHPHAAPPDRLRQAVQKLTDFADLYGLFTEWKSPERLLMTGKGVEAWVVLEAETLTVTVTLPWLFRLVRGVIESEIAERLQAIVAEAEAADPGDTALQAS